MERAFTGDGTPILGFGMVEGTSGIISRKWQGMHQKLWEDLTVAVTHASAGIVCPEPTQIHLDPDTAYLEYYGPVSSRRNLS